MSTTNPFDLLVDDDNDDPSHLIAAAQLQKVAAKKPAAPAAAPPAAAKLPSKPLPPAEAGELCFPSVCVFDRMNFGGTCIGSKIWDLD